MIPQVIITSTTPRQLSISVSSTSPPLQNGKHLPESPKGSLSIDLELPSIPDNLDVSQAIDNQIQAMEPGEGPDMVLDTVSINVCNKGALTAKQVEIDIELVAQRYLLTQNGIEATQEAQKVIHWHH